MKMNLHSHRKIAILSVASLGVATLAWMQLPRAQAAPNAASTRIEGSFVIENLDGDPFDFLANDVRVQLSGGARVLAVPAFFDGDATWRFRYTPEKAGRYIAEAVTRNGKKLEVMIAAREWKIGGAPSARFVRRDAKNPARFSYRNGAPYFPIGHNVAWGGGVLPSLPALFGKMGAAGENWSRVWMNHWDGKNLDWPKTGEFGTLNLEVARKWDGIVDAAAQNGIAFQMVFQHHGQYSTRVNSNWDENPYNAKNGGFLEKPEEFFTNERARVLTKRKLRYAAARWGYSPSILAWELFNEVQFTDAAHEKQWDAIVNWHREMADFLRAQDVQHHLVTSSSTDGTPPQLWQTLDFYQEHAYPSDVMVAMHEGNSHRDLPKTKPFFVGEFGPSQINDKSGVSLHNGVWAGLMSGEAGAPQYWAWDDVENNNLYLHYRAAANFLAASRFAAHGELKRSEPAFQSASLADLSFGPGGGWRAATQSDFTITPSGPPPGSGALPSFLQGNGHRDMNPQPLTFRVNFARAGRFIVSLEKIAKAGAHLKLRVGDNIVEREYSPAENDYDPTPELRELSIEVPPGAQTISLENSGADWATINRFTLTDYAPALSSYALSGRDFAAAWIYHRGNVTAPLGKESAPATGEMTLENLAPGRYRATWWDTRAGKVLSSSAGDCENEWEKSRCKRRRFRAMRRCSWRAIRCEMKREYSRAVSFRGTAHRTSTGAISQLHSLSSSISRLRDIMNIFKTSRQSLSAAFQIAAAALLISAAGSCAVAAPQVAQPVQSEAQNVKPIHLEAEGATLQGATVATKRAGFNGSGYVTGFQDKGARIEWSGHGPDKMPPNESEKHPYGDSDVLNRDDLQNDAVAGGVEQNGECDGADSATGFLRYEYCEYSHGADRRELSSAGAADAGQFAAR